MMRAADAPAKAMVFANVGVRSQIAINLPLSATVCVTIPEVWSGIYVVPEMFNVTGQLEENTILTRMS